MAYTYVVAFFRLIPDKVMLIPSPVHPVVICHIPGKSCTASATASDLRSGASGRQGVRPIADFVQKTVNKTAVRDLAVPIADVTSLNTLIESVIADNPFGCVGYTGADGQPVAAVIRNREHYTAKVDFIDAVIALE